MKRKRRIRKTLRKKYDLTPDGTHFKWFPDQKAKPFRDFAIISTPPSFNEEIEEVKSIISHFRPKQLPSQDAVKDLFDQRRWEIDYRFFSEEGLWDFDAYKNGVAVEVLGAQVDEVYKDCFKFLLAYRVKETKIGVIVVPHQTQVRKRPDAIFVDAILHRFSPVLQDYGLWLFRASYFVNS